MRPNRKLSAAIAAAAALTVQGMSSDALAADPSGAVVAVIPAAEANGIVGKRRLRVNADIFMGDSVATGAVGEAQILFADNTRLVVGPRSALLIDKFVINSAGAADKVALTAVRGAFRFITGNGRKQAYKITTPTATIGIRGTEFDFAIEPNGATSIAVFSGEAEFCDRRRRKCVRLSGGCSIASVAPQQDPRLVEAFQQRSELINDLFPFIQSPAPAEERFPGRVGVKLPASARQPPLQSQHRAACGGQPSARH